MDIQEIRKLAEQAATKAQQDYLNAHGDGCYCGFAWVNVYVERTNSKIAKELMTIGFKKDYMPKRLNLWAPGNYHGQSMDVLEAGARAYAEVLRGFGFRAHAGSRPD